MCSNEAMKILSNESVINNQYQYQILLIGNDNQSIINIMTINNEEEEKESSERKEKRKRRRK